ncbi:S1 family peptidase [Mycolicibacterium anyangense]|uniref:S1 family peptidase n=1 Tax=Mycolicibacterium anyangense TaxID=1431246 RepID=UPI0013D364D2|nr:serine protease [Mycolicibacterium anyangense]
MTDPGLNSRMPASIEWLTLLIFEAARFFSRDDHTELLAEFGKPEPPDSMFPFSTSDFLHYLQPRGFRHALSQGSRIQRVIDRMVACEMLTDYGQEAWNDVFGRRFFTNTLATRSQAKGWLWLAEVIGPELIIPSYGSITLPIVGFDNNNDVHIGTGVLLDERHILTNSHVVSDMRVERVVQPSAISPPMPGLPNQSAVTIVDWECHAHLDVAVITVEPEPGTTGLLPLDGVVFRRPEWRDETYVFGYPPIAQAAQAHVTVQRGQVVNPSISSWSRVAVPEDHPNWPDGDGNGVEFEYFLYSAISRPGNSGGPIVAQDGRLVGIVAHEVLDAGRADHPFYRGIPGQMVVTALGDLGYDDLAALEDWS